MTIREMHELFRLLGQQMGMERIRVILPTSIDGFLNDAILEITNNIIQSNVQVKSSERYIISDNFISPVNGISTLYSELLINSGITKTNDITNVTFNISDCLYFYAFSVKYNEDIKFRNCRIIEADKLERSCDDYLNRPTARYPIIHIVSFTGNVCNIQLHCGKGNVNSVKVKYIRKPTVVAFSESGNGVSCDLPIHLHKDVVELAVSKFFNSVGSTNHNIRQ